MTVTEVTIAQQAERFLDEQQAADLLHAKVRTLQDWRQRGTGPRWRRHGRLVRYALSDLLSWSEQNAAASTSAPKA